MRNLRSFYFGIDLRALAVLRIGLGSLLLFDLTKRIPGIGLWYVNSGLLPNHRVLWHPEPYQFSYFFALWTVAQVQVAFGVIAAIYLCFLCGYRTRLFHLLSWLTLLSLQTRTTFIANGGDYVFATLLLWTAFMPLGARWSIDGLRIQGSNGAERSDCFVSLSVAALRVQLCVIYLFNALSKTGDTWKYGTAVHYLLHQARIVTPIGLWLREHASSELLKALAYGTIVTEYAIPVLILVPWLAPWPRRLAIVLIWGLHTNIALLANLGMFSPVMLVFSLSLLSADDFRWLVARERVMRALGALARRTQPLRESLSRHLPPRPAEHRVGIIRARFCEAVVGFLIVCATSQLIDENGELLAGLAHDQPRAIKATVDYLRLNQGWSMFAPDAPTTDTWIVVDALTGNGEHVDPFNLRASLVSDPKLRAIPTRLGQDVYFCNYTLRIVDDAEFHEALHDWIFGHPRRTHQPEAAIERFDAYVIEHDSPPLGQLRATNTKARIFLSGSRDD
jgi:hypothetical protein